MTTIHIPGHDQMILMLEELIFRAHDMLDSVQKYYQETEGEPPRENEQGGSGEQGFEPDLDHIF